MSTPQSEDRVRREEPCAWRGSAQELMAGQLAAERVDAFHAHLQVGCEACAAELDAAQQLQAAFDAARFVDDMQLPEAPASLRERVLANMRAQRNESSSAPGEAAQNGRAKDDDESVQTWRRWTEAAGEAPGGLRTQRASEGKWEDTALAGISVRRLSVDAAQRQVTMMVRMAAGTAYPPHRHGGAEECFVVSGDLHVGDEVLTAGDFQRAEEGSIHGVQSTEGGCTLLIVSSLDDELLPAGG